MGTTIECGSLEIWAGLAHGGKDIRLVQRSCTMKNLEWVYTFWTMKALITNDLVFITVIISPLNS